MKATAIGRDPSGSPTANTAEGPPTTVRGSRPLFELGSIGSNGSAPLRQILESDTLREELEEHTAIIEFAGQLIREDAERAAWAVVSTRYRIH